MNHRFPSGPVTPTVPEPVAGSDFVMGSCRDEMLPGCVDLPAVPTRESASCASLMTGGVPAAAPTTRLAQMCGSLISRSPAMFAVYRRIRQVADTAATVFVSGETGTGKELVAHALHDQSERRHGAFVAINCGAVAAQLIESELFGHERGSFTGANRLHHGMFAQADNGTLFLDEITEMDVDLQVRLLRVLETGTFRRIGGEQTLRTNARIVAASNQDPLASVRAGRLRADLYYRLNVFPIALPPLRERGDDVALLAQFFLVALNRQHGTHKAFTAAALRRLQAHQWPGNVRELANFVHQAFLMAADSLDAEDAGPSAGPRLVADKVEVAVGMSVATAERALIVATVAHCDGNKRTAARILGISLKTLYVRLSLYAAVAIASR